MVLYKFRIIIINIIIVTKLGHSHPTQSHPIHGWIHSMSNCGPRSHKLSSKTVSARFVLNAVQTNSVDAADQKQIELNIEYRNITTAERSTGSRWVGWTSNGSQRDGSLSDVVCVLQRVCPRSDI